MAEEIIKKYLVCTYVRKNLILGVLEKIHNIFKIKYERIFVYEISNNLNEYIVTFNVRDKGMIFNKGISNLSLIHVKNGTIFSINALNMLIHREYGADVDTNSIYIEWEKYKNKLISISNGELNISDIKKIEDKAEFFND
jgi:hypothetical protein